MRKSKLPYNQRKKLAHSFKFLIKKSLDEVEKKEEKKEQRLPKKKESDEQTNLVFEREENQYDIVNKKENILQLRNEGVFLANYLNDFVKNVRAEHLDFDDLEDKIMNQDIDSVREKFMARRDTRNASVRKVKKEDSRRLSVFLQERRNGLVQMATKDSNNSINNIPTASGPSILRKQSRVFKSQNDMLKVGLRHKNTSEFEDRIERKRKTVHVKQAKFDLSKFDKGDKSSDQLIMPAPVEVEEKYIIPKIPKDKNERFRVLQRKHLIYDSLSDEDLEWKEAAVLLIHPNSRFKEVWDMIIFFVTLYNIIYVPFTMAFVDNPSLIQIMIDILCDMIYLIDLILQFFIPISKKASDDKMLMSYVGIALNYIIGWFFLDLISSIPFNSVLNIMQLIAGEEGQNNSLGRITNIAKLSKIYRIMKLFRLFKLIKIANHEDKNNFRYDNSNFLDRYIISLTVKRLFIFALYFIILNHMLACIWVYVGSMDYPNWISKLSMTDAADAELYVASLYFNLVTIFTIGYGDITSTNIYEYMYNVFLLVVGISTYTYAVSSISYIIEKSDEVTVNYNKKMDYLENLRIKHELPLKLYRKILRFLKYEYKINKTDKYYLLNDLPLILRNELINNMYNDMLRNYIFFKGITNTEFSIRVLVALRPLKAVRDDVIINEGDYIEELIFVRRGILSIEKLYKGHILKILNLRKKEHFGEVEMLLNQRCQFTVKVKSRVTELNLIKKTDLIDIGSEYPETFDIITQRSSHNMIQMEQLVTQQKIRIDVLEQRIMESKHHKADSKSLESDESLIGEDVHQEMLIDKELERLVSDLNARVNNDNHSSEDVSRRMSMLLDTTSKMNDPDGPIKMFRRQSHLSLNNLVLERPPERKAVTTSFKDIRRSSVQLTSDKLQSFKFFSPGEKKITKSHFPLKFTTTEIQESPLFQRADLKNKTSIIKSEIKRNIFDGSMNLKNPITFYYKFIQKSKEQREMLENKKTLRRLDSLVKLFN
jgi:CRP-like cAMP-binding protein